uniref:cDNA FLJ42271 fis, clone TKIDN2015788 n=1 Tax=Homo sapiens TaxID=9606 RepID=Q6ZVP2_HUMAN|nr:unnamed protein product [Homo sapiens]
MMPGMATLMADSMCDDSYSSCGRQSISSSRSLPSSSCSLSHATVLLIAISDAKGTGLSVSIMGVELRERAGCLPDAPRGRHRPSAPRAKLPLSERGLIPPRLTQAEASGWGRRDRSKAGGSLCTQLQPLALSVNESLSMKLPR